MPTETGNYKSRNPSHWLDARNGGSITAKFKHIVNQPLPWVCVFALILIAYIWIDSERRADMRVQLTEAQLSAQAANQRISDNLAAQAQIQAAFSQTINDNRNRAIDAETQALLMREHYDKIANDFAAQGYVLPALPKELKPAK